MQNHCKAFQKNTFLQSMVLLLHEFFISHLSCLRPWLMSCCGYARNAQHAR